MITAAEALRLPSARLSPEETHAADVLLQAIENHVVAHMSRAGCEEPFTTKEKRSSVLTEVTQRLKVAGWIPRWQIDAEKGRFSDNVVIKGWKLMAIGPTDEAYRQADEIVASA